MARKGKKIVTRTVQSENVVLKVKPAAVYIPLSILRQKKKTPPKPKPERVRLHVFQRAAQIWKPRYRGQELKFFKKTLLASETIEAFLETMSGAVGPGWAITEVHERGSGVWSKGSTIHHGSDRASSSLADLGWNAGRVRSDGLPLVWVTVHPVAI